MRVIILKDYQQISKWVAEYIHFKINKGVTWEGCVGDGDEQQQSWCQQKVTSGTPQRANNTDKIVLGLPTGSTPIGVYENLIKLKTNFNNVITFNMDEYIGLSPEHKQSYHYFMNHHLFSKINIDLNNINIPNGIATDIEKECSDYEDKIKMCGGIDLFLCGIGSDGHIAFNEPGSSFNSVTRVKTLTDETIMDNSRFFDNIDMVPKTAITVGIKTILDAKEIIIMASGINKANAVKQLIEGNISTQFPCTISQTHKNATIIIDETAASELKYKTVLYYKQMQEKIDMFGKSFNRRRPDAVTFKNGFS